MLADLILGLCCVPIQKELLSLARYFVCGISFTGEVVNTKAGTCDPFGYCINYALLAKVNKLSAEISVAEILWTVARSNSVPPSIIVSGQKMTAKTISVPAFLAFAGILLS